MKREKVETVEMLVEKLKQNSTVILTDYRGLTVAQIAKLRKDLRESSTEYRVIKNTLAKLAADKLNLAELSKLLRGPVALALSNEPIGPAKVLNTFAKENKGFEVKGAVIDGRALTGDEIKRLAELPSRETLIAMLIGQLQSPVYGIVNVLNGPIQNLVYVLNAIGQRKAA